MYWSECIDEEREGRGDDTVLGSVGQRVVRGKVEVETGGCTGVSGGALGL